MNRQISNNNKSFCLAPWLHSYLDPTGQRSLCCVFDGKIGKFQDSIEDIWNGSEYRNIRRMMLNGEKIDGCHRCPMNTEQTSYRDYWNTFFSHYKNYILDNTSIDGEYNPLPISLDYRTSKCNFKCKMCNSKFSSAIYNEEYKQKKGQGIDPILIQQYDPSFIKSQNELTLEEVKLLAPNLQEMSWAGGEPLINENHWEGIQYLINCDYAKNIHLRYTTNLSSLNYKNYDLLKTIPNFKKVDIYASIDATHNIGEWIRSGFKYKKFVDNLKKLKTLNCQNLDIKLMVSCSIPTIIDLPNINKLASDFNLDIQIQNVVGTTSLLMIKFWPYDVISKLLDKTKKDIEKQQTKNTPTIIKFLDDEYNKDNFIDVPVEKLRHSHSEILYLDKHRKHKDVQFRDIIKIDKGLLQFYDYILQSKKNVSES